MEVEYLKMIQGVITRLSGFSFQIKGWSITLTSALVGFGVKDHPNPWFVGIALIPALIFWGLDAYYLMLERIFRNLYEKVCDEDKLDPAQRSVPPYWLNPWKKVVLPHTSWIEMLVRPAVIGFHLPLVGSVVLILGLVLSGVVQPAPESPAAANAPTPAPALSHWESRSREDVCGTPVKHPGSSPVRFRPTPSPSIPL